MERFVELLADSADEPTERLPGTVAINSINGTPLREADAGLIILQASAGSGRFPR